MSQALAFPRLEDRGPIEAGGLASLKRQLAGLRGWKNATQFKRDDFRANDSTDVTFPRLKDRGPIEARSAQENLGPPHQFPRLKDRGPIEAGSYLRSVSM